MSDIADFHRWLDDEGVTGRLTTRKEVCPRCDGEGTHVNPNVDGNGITSAEMAELGDDFLHDYLRGAYDVTCYTCNGRNVVDVPDLDRTDPDIVARWLDWQDDVANMRAIARAERLMGA